MKYVVTQQYAKDEENAVAEFNNAQDAEFFIERKSISDQEKSSILIYRLFQDQRLLKVFNKEKISTRIIPARFADGDSELPYKIGPFKIGNDTSAANASAGFIHLNDAELFIEDKLTHTQAITTYYIFNNDALIIELNQRIKKRY